MAAARVLVLTGASLVLAGTIAVLETAVIPRLSLLNAGRHVAGSRLETITESAR